MPRWLRAAARDTNGVDVADDCGVAALELGVVVLVDVAVAIDDDGVVLASRINSAASLAPLLPTT